MSIEEAHRQLVESARTRDQIADEKKQHQATYTDIARELRTVFEMQGRSTERTATQLALLGIKPFPLNILGRVPLTEFVKKVLNGESDAYHPRRAGFYDDGSQVTLTKEKSDAPLTIACFCRLLNLPSDDATIVKLRETYQQLGAQFEYPPFDGMSLAEVMRQKAGTTDVKWKMDKLDDAERARIEDIIDNAVLQKYCP